METKEIIQKLNTIISNTKGIRDYFVKGDFKSDFDFNWELCKIRDTAGIYHTLWQKTKCNGR